MATKSKKSTARRSVSKAATKAARSILTGTHTIKVLKKENPFTAKVQAKLADVVLKSKTVAEAQKKSPTTPAAISWAVRELVKRHVIKCERPKAA